MDQLENLRRKYPVLRPATPPLIHLSAQESKTFVTGWVRLRLRWNKGDNENDFVAKGLLGISGVKKLLLLPGGKTVRVIGDYGSVSLYRIELKDGRASLPIVANLKYDQRVIFGPKWNKLLTATSPCPILIRRQGDERGFHFFRALPH